MSLLLLSLLGLVLAVCSTPPQGPLPIVVMLPDTQLYSESNPEIFHDQTRWVADHVEEENIRFVTHVGDIVQNYDQVEEEWQVADDAMARIEELVPWGVAIGNHDDGQRRGSLGINQGSGGRRSVGGCSRVGPIARSDQLHGRRLRTAAMVFLRPIGHSSRNSGN